MRKVAIIFLCIVVLGLVIFFILNDFSLDYDKQAETPLPNESKTSGLVATEPSRAEGANEIVWRVNQSVGLHWAGHGLTNDIQLAIIDGQGTVLDQLDVSPERFETLNEFGGSYIYTVPQKLESKQVRFQVTQKAKDGKKS